MMYLLFKIFLYIPPEHIAAKGLMMWTLCLSSCMQVTSCCHEIITFTIVAWS